LIVVRIVQGVATGAASSALSAAVVELAPERRKKLGALMTGMAPVAGLGIGALFASALAQDRVPRDTSTGPSRRGPS